MVEVIDFEGGMVVVVYGEVVVHRTKSSLPERVIKVQVLVCVLGHATTQGHHLGLC